MKIGEHIVDMAEKTVTNVKHFVKTIKIFTKIT